VRGDWIKLRNDDFNTLPSVVTVRVEKIVLPTDKIVVFFFRLCPSSDFFLQIAKFLKPALFPSLGKEAPNLMEPLERVILGHWAP
jgi:hypothetical protein